VVTASGKYFCAEVNVKGIHLQVSHGAVNERLHGATERESPYKKQRLS
jgi:hypothetical protein